MANVLTNSQYYTDIANAIRAKKHVGTQYLPSEMAEAILSIETGGRTPRREATPSFYFGTLKTSVTQWEGNAYGYLV